MYNISNVILGTDYDFLICSEGEDTIVFNYLPLEKIDPLRNSLGENAIVLLDGDDTAEDGSSNHIYFGNRGNDSISGKSGRDTLCGGRDLDSIDGGEDSDFLFGNNDDDVLKGGAGHDSLFGGKEHDLLFGGDGNDFLSGDLGDDTLQGDDGLDTLSGKDGRDVFKLSQGLGFDIITDYARGVDLLKAPTGIVWKDLKFISSGEELQHTLISVKNSGEPIAVLLNVKADTIAPSDFGFPDIPTPPPESNIPSTLEPESISKSSDSNPPTTPPKEPQLPPKLPTVEITPNTVILGGNQSEWKRGDDNDNFLSGGEGNDTLAGEKQQDWLMGNAGEDVFVLQPKHGQTSLDSNRFDIIIDFNPNADQIAIESPVNLAEIIYQPYIMQEGAWKNFMGSLTALEKLGISYADLKKKILNDDLGILSAFISPNTLQILKPIVASDLDLKQLDPDMNGILEGVLISQPTPGQESPYLYHGFILNSTVADVQNRVFSI